MLVLRVLAGFHVEQEKWACLYMSARAQEARFVLVGLRARSKDGRGKKENIRRLWKSWKGEVDLEEPTPTVNKYPAVFRISRNRRSQMVYQSVFFSKKFVRVSRSLGRAPVQANRTRGADDPSAPSSDWTALRFDWALAFAEMNLAVVSSVQHVIAWFFPTGCLACQAQKPKLQSCSAEESTSQHVECLAKRCREGEARKVDGTEGMGEKGRHRSARHG